MIQCCEKGMGKQVHESMICQIISKHFGQMPKYIKRMSIGISNEVYLVSLETNQVIARLRP